MREGFRRNWLPMRAGSGGARAVEGVRWGPVSEPPAEEEDTLLVLGRKLRLWIACLGPGTAYGAAVGTLVDTFLLPGVGILIGVRAGALAGFLGGGVAGVGGTLLGGRLGWGLAGMLGGLSAVAIVWCGPWYGPDAPRIYLDGFDLLVTGTGALIGGALGLAVGYGARSGSSSLPGVQPLVDILNEGKAPRPPEPLPAASELVPARAPQGRGDEAAPAGDGAWGNQ